MIRTGRKIAIIVLPVLTVVSGILLNFYGTEWINWVFMVSLSGTVGIGTNYIAIKMLFRPHEKTVFGRQGLIPRRRDDIAIAIADAVSQQLLDTDSILRHLEQNNVIRNAASGALAFAHNWIDNPVNRTQVINAVARYVQNRGSEQAGYLLSKVVTLIKTATVEKLSSETVWHQIRNAIEREIEKPDTLQLLTEVVTNLISQNAPKIAELVNNMIEEWIDSKPFLVSMAMHAGAGLLGVDTEMISKELNKKVNSPSFSAEVMDFISDNLTTVVSMADDPEIRTRFSGFYKEQKTRLYNWLNTEGVRLAKDSLTQYLESEAFWIWLSSQLDLIVTKLKKLLQAKIESEEFRKTIKTFVLEHANKVDIHAIVKTKVSEFELQQLEDLITEVSGESLAGIELFGGILGMLAGLILINQWFSVLLAAAAALLFFAERLLKKKH